MKKRSGPTNDKKRMATGLKHIHDNSWKRQGLRNVREPEEKEIHAAKWENRHLSNLDKIVIS